MRYRTVGVGTTGRAPQPIIARCQTIQARVEPVAYDWVKLVVVRQGSAILLSEFGERHIKVGDVLVLGTQTLCGSEPEGAITVTALYLDRDYLIDQIFWQHISLLTDRLDAQDFAQELYSEPAQILRLGEDRVGMLMPWLDELVALSLDGGASERFFRMQSLLFAVLDVIAPYMETTTSRHSSAQRRSAHLYPPHRRKCVPLRAEAREAVRLLRARPAERWTLQGLAEAVHLSTSQLGRVFLDAYGKPPMTYLATVRAERLAQLLRQTDMPVEAAMREVGWHSRGHAARMFRRAVGVTPHRYRQLARQQTAA